MLNQDLRQQLSQDMALVLLQPKGEPEYNMKELAGGLGSNHGPAGGGARQRRHGDASTATDIPPES